MQNERHIGRLVVHVDVAEQTLEEWLGIELGPALRVPHPDAEEGPDYGIEDSARELLAWVLSNEPNAALDPPRAENALIPVCIIYESFERFGGEATIGINMPHPSESCLPETRNDRPAFPLPAVEIDDPHSGLAYRSCNLWRAV